MKINLEEFEEQLRIVNTGKNSAGNSFNDIGRLNSAAWIGEHSGVLITEIKGKSDKISRLVTALGALLGEMDYTTGMCSATEMVGAVVDKRVIALARKAIKDSQ